MPRLRILHAASLAMVAILVTIPFAIAQDVATVPSMVKFSGTVREAKSRILGVTFALYKDEQVGSPLWMETQSVSLDSAGHYNVQLGATLPAGLPKELFASGEARWLGVQPEGQVGAFVSEVQTRPCPTFGRPVHLGFPHRLRPGTSPQALRIPSCDTHLMDTLPSEVQQAVASGRSWLVSSFRLRARLDASIPSAFSSQRGYEPRFLDMALLI